MPPAAPDGPVNPSAVLTLRMDQAVAICPYQGTALATPSQSRLTGLPHGQAPHEQSVRVHWRQVEVHYGIEAE